VGKALSLLLDGLVSAIALYRAIMS